MRVVSLLPAATEIVAALGLADRLVAVSHDCDFPSVIQRKPKVTHCEIHGQALSSEEVDSWVRDTLAERGTLYTIDEALLRELEPDVVLSQQLCDVCAPSYGSVAQLAATLPGPPRVVNLEPLNLADIFDNVRTVAEVVGAPELGQRLAEELVRRVDAVRERAASAERRTRCILLEWTNPPFRSGHWGPELVDIAGGVELLGRAGEPSAPVDWTEVLDAQPDVLVVACCGQPVARTLNDILVLQAKEGWDQLPAVESDRVYVVDGSAYFSRPGPRIVDSLELLASILHPELFPEWRAELMARDRVMRVRTGSQA